MFSVKVETADLQKVEKALSKMTRQIPFATALGITKTAKQVKENEKKEILKVFDNPTRFTQNSIFMKAATKKNLTAVVWLRDMVRPFRVNHYLEPQIFGGNRPKKRLEILLNRKGLPGKHLVPGKGVKRNKFGNVSYGQIGKVLSGLFAQSDPLNNETAKTRKRKRKKGEQGFFIVQKQRGKLRAGVYERFGRSVKPIFISVSKARYKKRQFDFFGVAERTIKRDLPRFMDEAIEQVIKTAWK